jgi:hypothetical protein
VIVSSRRLGIHVDAQTVGAAVHAVGLIRQDQMLDVGEGGSCRRRRVNLPLSSPVKVTVMGPVIADRSSVSSPPPPSMVSSSDCRTE